MKVLFLTRKFAPQNYIGAIRPTKFAKYLTSLYNYKVDVVCMEDESDRVDSLSLKDIEHINHVSTIPYIRWTTRFKNWYARRASHVKIKYIESNNNQKKRGLLKGVANCCKDVIVRVIRNVLYLISLTDSYIYGKRVVKELKKSDVIYQVFFSTTSLIESYVVGKWLKQRNPGIKWIYDLRDPLRISAEPMLTKYISTQILRKTIKLADEVTGVSEACVAEFVEYGHPSTRIIPNGYDLDDLSNALSASAKPILMDPKKFKIVYTGRLYDGKRDVSLLLKVLAKMADNNKIALSDIELHYAGPDFENIRVNIDRAGIELNVVDHGFVTREQSLYIQQNADLLLLLSWNADGETGVVTGKFYEYLMIGRPIGCFISGNLPNSILRSLIAETGSGFCYEEADETTYLVSAQYIENLWNNRESVTLRNPNAEKYNYKQLAATLNSIFNEES